MTKDIILVALFIVALLVFCWVIIRILNPSGASMGRKVVTRDGVILDVDESSKVKILQQGNRMNIQIATAVDAGSASFEPVRIADADDGFEWGVIPEMLDASPMGDTEPGTPVDAKWWAIARAVAATDDLNRKRELAEYLFSVGVIDQDMADGFLMSSPKEESKKEAAGDDAEKSSEEPSDPKPEDPAEEKKPAEAAPQQADGEVAFDSSPFPEGGKPESGEEEEKPVADQSGIPPAPRADAVMIDDDDY